MKREDVLTECRTIGVFLLWQICTCAGGMKKMPSDVAKCYGTCCPITGVK